MMLRCEVVLTRIARHYARDIYSCDNSVLFTDSLVSCAPIIASRDQTSSLFTDISVEIDVWEDFMGFRILMNSDVRASMWLALCLIFLACAASSGLCWFVLRGDASMFPEVNYDIHFL